MRHSLHLVNGPDRSTGATQLLQQLPLILSEAVRPMEKIDSIRIVQVAGMPGSASTTGQGNAAQGTFPEQVMNSALQYQIAKPIVDAVMKDAGLSNEGITGMAQSLAGMLSTQESTTPSSALLQGKSASPLAQLHWLSCASLSGVPASTHRPV